MTVGRSSLDQDSNLSYHILTDFYLLDCKNGWLNGILHFVYLQRTFDLNCGLLI